MITMMTVYRDNPITRSLIVLSCRNSSHYTLKPIPEPLSCTLPGELLLMKIKMETIMNIYKNNLIIDSPTLS